MKARIFTCISATSLLTLVSFLAFAQPTEAKVVYTPVNVTLSGNGYIKLDLNQDQKTDFTIQAVSQVAACGIRDGLIGSATMVPTQSNGVIVTHLRFAALLQSGVQIDSSGNFYKAQTVITQFFICSYGNHHADGYLGLEFQINGQTHYGWAQVSVDAHYDYRRSWMRTTLTGFAYETNPGQEIKTGESPGAAEDPTASLDSPSPKDSQSCTVSKEEYLQILTVKGVISAPGN